MGPDDVGILCGIWLQATGGLTLASLVVDQAEYDVQSVHDEFWSC